MTEAFNWREQDFSSPLYLVSLSLSLSLSGLVIYSGGFCIAHYQQKFFLFKCKYSESSFCTLWNELDTVFHVFCEYCKLSPLFLCFG